MRAPTPRIIGRMTPNPGLVEGTLAMDSRRGVAMLELRDLIELVILFIELEAPVRIFWATFATAEPVLDTIFAGPPNTEFKVLTFATFGLVDISSTVSCA